MCILGIVECGYCVWIGGLLVGVVDIGGYG